MELPFEELIERLIRIENHLLGANTRKKDPNSLETDKLMTVDQAAEFLGLTKGSIYQLVHKNRIPYSKKGRLYFSEKELRAWIQTGRQQTVQEIQDEALNALKEKP